MKWNYNRTTGLANNDNEFFRVKKQYNKDSRSVYFFFFLRIRRKNLKSNNVPVGVVIVLESEGLYSVPGIQEKKRNKKNFAPVC